MPTNENNLTQPDVHAPVTSENRVNAACPDDSLLCLFEAYAIFEISKDLAIFVPLSIAGVLIEVFYAG
jgi:hypothetical protein